MSFFNPNHLRRGSILLPTLVSLLLNAGLMAIELKSWKFDFSHNMYVAKHRATEPEFQAITHFNKTWGYDSQFYYALAQAPGRVPTPTLDHPVRQLRIGYPLLCYLLSAGGDPVALLYVMPAVNLLCLAGLTALGAIFAKRYGQSPWWGVWVPFVTIALAPAVRNLTDPLGLVCLLGLFVAWDARHAGGVLLCASLGIFAREQNLAIAAFIGLGCLYERRFWLAAGLVAVAVGWLGYVAYLHAGYGMMPTLPRASNLAPPFEGLSIWYHTISPTPKFWFMRFCYGLFMLGNLVWLAVHLVTLGRASGLLGAAGVLAVFLAVVAGPAIWEDWWSYTRNLAMLPLVVWCLHIQAGNRYGLAWSIVSLLLVPGSLRIMR